MKRIIFTVTNDLSYDQRMQRICSALSDAGYHCELVGRKLPDSRPLQSFNFKQTRIKCFFNKGFAFYAEYNIRLFFYLQLHRYDTICSIDLDTILPGFLSSKMKSKTQVYDAHEYFSQMEEVVTRPRVHKVWLGIEQVMMKRIKHVYTIGQGYADIFKKQYGIEASIIRNVPKSIPKTELQEPIAKSIIYQGAINVGRGIEEMIDALNFLPDYTFHVYGNGSELDRLKMLSEELNVPHQVFFHGALLPDDLRKATSQHGIGLTLFSAVGEHHQLSLANRFFDYIQSGVPQIAMNYKEYAAINDEFEIGVLIDELKPENIVNAIQKLETDQELYSRLKANCMKAREVLNWDNESKKLIEFYKNL